MLRQEELALFKAISTLQLSPAILKKLLMALSRRKKKPGSVGSEQQHRARGKGRSPPTNIRTACGQAQSQRAGKLGRLIRARKQAPSPSEGSAPLPASAPAFTGEQAASCSRQLGPPEGGSTYAAVLPGSVVPFQRSGSLKPTAMDSDPSEPAVSSEAVNRRISSDMSGPLSDMPVGTTTHAQETFACLPAGERPNKTPIFISGVRDARAFLAWWRAFVPWRSDGLTES